MLPSAHSIRNLLHHAVPFKSHPVSITGNAARRVLIGGPISGSSSKGKPDQAAAVQATIFVMGKTRVTRVSRWAGVVAVSATALVALNMSGVGGGTFSPPYASAFPTLTGTPDDWLAAVCKDGLVTIRTPAPYRGALGQWNCASSREQGIGLTLFEWPPDISSQSPGWQHLRGRVFAMGLDNSGNTWTLDAPDFDGEGRGIASLQPLKQFGFIV